MDVPAIETTTFTDFKSDFIIPNRFKNENILIIIKPTDGAIYTSTDRPFQSEFTPLKI